MLQIFAGDGRPERQPHSRCRARRDLRRRGPPGRQARVGCLYVPRQVGSSCASQMVSRTGPPARVPDASGESLVPFVCETAHTSIGGSERRLEPLPLPCQAPRHRQPVSGSDRPIRLTPGERATTSLPASSSNEFSARIRIDPSYLQSASRLRSCCTAGARAKRPRVDGSSKAVVAEPLTTAEGTQAKDCGPHLEMS